MGEDGDFVDTMDTWLQARLEALHTTLPGKIQTYNPGTRLATVVPGVRLRSMHGDLIDIKPIAGVPVVWPGSKAFSVIPAALEAGDGVLLHFSEAALGAWLNGTDVHDPEDETRFSLHDCIAVPGLWQTLKVPDGQDLGGADFGIVGGRGEVLGGKDGKLDLHNATTDLRTVLEALQAILPAMDTALSLLPASPAAVPYTTQTVKIGKALTKIKGLLA